MRELGRDQERVRSCATRQRLFRAASTGILLFAFMTVSAAARDGSGPRLQDLDGNVRALVVYAGTLVAGGDFTGTGSAPQYLARWTGTGWQGFEPPLDGPVTSLAVMQGDLIVGGLFENAGAASIAHVVRWDGGTWVPLGAGTNGPVHALLVQADAILYVGGAFSEAGGVPAKSIARYVGSTWSPLSAGLDGEVDALTLFNGNLVAGGDFQVVGPDPWERNLARFVGTEWRSIARGIDGRVSALAVYRGGLVAGGRFNHADFVTPAHHIASFMGEWYPIGFGFGELDSLDASEVRSLTLQGDDLVAGGTFGLADLSIAPGVARYDGTAWLPLGTGVDAPVNALAADGDVLYAGGEFHSAGTWGCSHVAAFRGADWCPMNVVPIAIEAFEAVGTPAGVRLTWQVSAGARNELAGIGVQRALDPRGPFVDCTGSDLVPTSHMEYFDAGVPNPGQCWYRLVLVGRDGVHSYAGPVQVERGAPRRTALAAPRELPGDAGVGLAYALASPGRVRLLVYDVRGRLLRNLDVGMMPAGEHTRIWDRRDEVGAHVCRGVYMVRLDTGGVTATRKLVLKRP